MGEGSADVSAVRRMVDAVWSAHAASADPDDPVIPDLVTSGSISPGEVDDPSVRNLVERGLVRSSLAADPDDPRVRGFAEFGLSPSSAFATQDQLLLLEEWREGLRIPANSRAVAILFGLPR